MKKMWQKVKGSVSHYVRDQKGIGLFQMLLAIALFMMFIGVAAMQFSDARTKQKIQQARQNRDIIRTNIQTIFTQAPDYSSLSNSIQGVFPDVMKKSSGTKNSWNGDVTVAVDATDSTRFTITFADVPETACVQLAAEDGWETITVGGTSISSGSSAVSSASSACGDSNTIVWTSN